MSNLVNSIKYSRYIESNKKTISIYTKIGILIQIVLTLRYLKNSGTVYFNLHPKNIYMKKGLLVKLFNFTNSYQVENKFEIDHNNIFPYIYKGENEWNNERSDVFSLGCIIYNLIYYDNPLKIK